MCGSNSETFSRGQHSTPRQLKQRFGVFVESACCPYSCVKLSDHQPTGPCHGHRPDRSFNLDLHSLTLLAHPATLVPWRAGACPPGLEPNWSFHGVSLSPPCFQSVLAGKLAVSSSSSHSYCSSTSWISAAFLSEAFEVVFDEKVLRLIPPCSRLHHQRNPKRPRAFVTAMFP